MTGARSEVRGRWRESRKDCGGFLNVGSPLNFTLLIIARRPGVLQSMGSQRVRHS